MNGLLRMLVKDKIGEKKTKGIERIYCAELKVMLDKEEKILTANQFKTAKRQILPKIALYKGFLNYYDREESIHYCRDIFYKQILWAKYIVAFLTSTTFGTNLFKKFFANALYSDVWDIDIYQNDKKRLNFDIKRCLYSDLCTKYGCGEFTPVFCGGDFFMFGNMKRLEFSRKGTIGQGEKICDFHFKNK